MKRDDLLQIEAPQQARIAAAKAALAQDQALLALVQEGLALPLPPPVVTPPVIVPPPVDLPPVALLPLLTLSYLANDDSVKINIAPSMLPGIADYRAILGHNVKYAGGKGRAALSDFVQIEMNGLEPGKEVVIIVEAVSLLGPYLYVDDQTVMPECDDPLTCDGVNCPCSMPMNGHGDPANQPVPLARGFLSVMPQAKILVGEQVFFDNFRQPLTFQTVAQDPRLFVDTSRPVRYRSERWIDDLYLAWDRLDECHIFLMNAHKMTVLADGGKVWFPYADTPENRAAGLYGKSKFVGGTAYASLLMKPITAPKDISGGRVLHVTGEWDAHNSGRAWQDVFVYPAGEAVSQPAWAEVQRNPFAAHTGLVATVQRHFLGVMQFDEQKGGPGWMNSGILSGFKRAGYSPGFENADSTKTWLPYRISPNHLSVEDSALIGLENGNDNDNDNRHTFDFYVSQTHFKAFETVSDVRKLKVDWPLAVPLSFDKIEVSFGHQYYHSALLLNELTQIYGNRNGPNRENLWIDRTPYSDERHWDNLGLEVLTAMP